MGIRPERTQGEGISPGHIPLAGIRAPGSPDERNPQERNPLADTGVHTQDGIRPVRREVAVPGIHVAALILARHRAGEVPVAHTTERRAEEPGVCTAALLDCVRTDSRTKAARRIRRAQGHRNRRGQAHRRVWAQVRHTPEADSLCPRMAEDRVALTSDRPA